MKPLKELPEELRRRVAVELAGIPAIAAPPADRVMARMAELRAIGLEDIPVYCGMSSTVRQYALATLAECDPRMAGQKLAFGTEATSLLERADELERRFGVRPISMIALMIEEAEKSGNATRAAELRKARARAAAMWER